LTSPELIVDDNIDLKPDRVDISGTV
jgi:hypothetical protein